MSLPPLSLHAQRATPSSSRRPKRSEVYILVPRSPYSPCASETVGPRTFNGTHHNPPTPLREHNMPIAESSLTVLKRKRSEGNLGETEQRAPEAKSKRPKISAMTNKTQGSTKLTRTVASTTTEEFPNGFFYCHQCNKKRDSSVGLYCTYKIRSSNSIVRCKAKYCRPCLKNRYGQDLDEIKERGIDGHSTDAAAHDKAQGYIFKCPRCLGICNCRACRKAKGLEPTGNLTSAAKKTGADSVAVMLDKNVKMIGILPGRGRQIPEQPKRPKVPKPPKVPKSDAPTTAPKPRVPVSRKPKPLPKVLWTPVPVPPSFTLDLALPRIAIREFALRFGKVLDMSRTHIEELEEIGGRRSHEVDDDDDLEQDIDVEMGWVGETCLRALLLGLLSLLLNNLPESCEKQKKAIQGAIQEIKASRANLSRIWSALAAMRAEFKKIDNKPIFPDPPPPPQHTKIHTTRSGALNGTGVNVTSTAQLVPVILSLTEMVLNAQAIRDEFEGGVKEAKERIKEERERTKAIREQWEGMKKTNNPDKVARMEYKRSLSALEQAQRVTSHAYALRFAPLGTDHEGRIYFALAPSVVEREAAAALLAGDMTKGGKAQGRAVVSTNERSALRRWGWFISVWGKKPVDGIVPAGEDDDEDDDDVEDVERWWGIWQPDEIRRLADWIAIKNVIAEEKRLTTDTTKSDDHDKRAAAVSDGRGPSAAGTKTGSHGSSRSGASSSKLTPLSVAFDTEDEPGFDSSLSSVSGDESDEEPNGDDGDVQMRGGYARPLPSPNELKTLVKALIEYADVLDWRVWRMEDEPGRDSKENGAVKDKDKTKAGGGRIRAVSPANFYGSAAR